MKQVCDRDNHYFYEPKKTSDSKRVTSSLKQKVRETVKSDIKSTNGSANVEEQDIYSHRRNKRDEEIANNLKDELAKSSDLIQIEKTIDQREFEHLTNQNFNKNFDIELMENGQLIPLPMKKSE